MKYIYLFLVIVCLPEIVFAQKELTHYFNGIQFKHVKDKFKDTLVIISINERHYNKNGKILNTFSDKETGDLLFLTTNKEIYNPQLEKFPNSQGFSNDNLSNSTSQLIVPFPDGSPQFYIFNIGLIKAGQEATRLCYSILDLRTKQGSVKTNNIKVRDMVDFQITGIQDCANRGYWIVVLDDNKKDFYSYHITEKGFDSIPVVTSLDKSLCDEIEIRQPHYYRMIISPDGTKIALSLASRVFSNRKTVIYLFDYDNKTGRISNKRKINKYDYSGMFTHIQFSPNSNILYASYSSADGVFQYDLSSGNESIIQNSEIIYLHDNYRRDFQETIELMPNKKMYIFRTTRFDIIHLPNNMGENWKLQKDAIVNGGDMEAESGGNGFPNFMQHYFSDDYKGYPCFEPRGTLDTIYGCINTPLRITHRYSDGIILSRQWSIDSANIIEQRDSSCLFSIKKTGTYRIQLFCKRNSRIDTLLTYAIINDAQAQAGKDTILCAGTSIKIGTQGEQGTTYRWYPTKGLDDYTKANPTASPDTTTEYIFAVINKYGCSAFDTIKITVVPSVQPTITRDTTLCAWIPLQLQAGGGTKYEWFPKSGLNNYFIANPIAMPSTTTRYKVIISNATCTDSAFVTITIKENEKADAGRDKELCAGLSVRLGTNNNPQVEYSWSPADYLDNPKSANPLCTPEKNMQYILTVKNNNGCENYDTVNVTLGGELSVFAGADTNVCEGEQIQLNASGAENFSWSPAEGLSNATIANPIFTGTSTTQYIVTGKSGNCEGKDTILVTVNEKPIIIASENREICVGDTVHLSAKGATEYSWSPADGLNNATIANPIFMGTKTTEYIVTGKNGNCFDSKKVIIMVNEKPIVSVSENREICTGDTVHLSAKGALEYSWSPVEGLNNPTIANPIFIGTKTTEYIVTGKTGDCFDSKKILITVNEKPTLSVSENREICLGDTVHLRANNADNYLWTPSTYLNNATISNPIAQPTENITYTVRGTNTNGCYEEKTISITINNDQEKTISLQLSDTAHYAPGTIVPVKIVIPAGLAQTTVTLNYDPCCVRCDSIFTPNTGISTVFLRNNALRFTSISPNKESREIILPCTIYLPPDGRNSEKFTLSDIIHSEQCLIVRGNNDEILYDPSCAWQFRGVQQTGRFGIESDGTIARLYTGYGGAITVKIFDVTGMEVWHYSSLYNSTDMQEISLPSLSSGMYIMQASNGVWHDECVMMK
ncbi:MAG: hypothetical protein J0M05_01195 [Candidatus Kapabacteria bacterium]|nr:hypothetical protein [Candidatus Kapabacteria bacterium]